VLKIQGVSNARIRAKSSSECGFPDVQFIVVGDGLAFGDQEDRMAIDIPRLQAANVAVVVGGRVPRNGSASPMSVTCVPLQGSVTSIGEFLVSGDGRAIRRAY
jgi:hypothetical protein